MKIDGFQFARSSSELAGVIDAAQLPRLAEMQCRTPGIRFRLKGGMNDRGKASLGMELSADMELVCQRCMQPLAFGLKIETDLELAKSQTEIESADDEVDRILASRSMDLAAMVEDEAILALPMIPRHEHCSEAAPGAVPAVMESVQPAQPVSPFGVLAALKQGRKKG